MTTLAQKPPRVKAEARDVCSLTLSIAGTKYRVKPVRCDLHSGASRCFELVKRDGEQYHVSQHAHGAECTCADFEYRHRDNGSSCKHLRALSAFGIVTLAPRPIRGGAETVEDRYGAIPPRVRRRPDTPPPSALYREPVPEYVKGRETDDLVRGTTGHPAGH
jgi:hypothetical protein